MRDYLYVSPQWAPRKSVSHDPELAYPETPIMFDTIVPGHSQAWCLDTNKDPRDCIYHADAIANLNEWLDRLPRPA